jgi:hypothetical protein
MSGIDDLIKVLGFGTPLVYAAGTYGLFLWLDRNASDEAKAALSGFLQAKDYDRARVSSAIVQVFDRLYTRPLMHYRAFFSINVADHSSNYGISLRDRRTL